MGYSSDPEIVRGLLLQAAAAHPEVLEDPKPDVIFTDYGDNSINFALRIWTAKAHTPLALKSDLYFALFKLFKREWCGTAVSAEGPAYPVVGYCAAVCRTEIHSVDFEHELSCYAGCGD